MALVVMFEGPGKSGSNMAHDLIGLSLLYKIALDLLSSMTIVKDPVMQPIQS